MNKDQWRKTEKRSPKFGVVTLTICIFLGILFWLMASVLPEGALSQKYVPPTHRSQTYSNASKE